MKHQILGLSLAVSIGMLHAAASATPFTINTGLDFGNNGSTQTSRITGLSYNDSLTTIGYQGNPYTVGTTVIETNRTSQLNSIGFNLGATQNISGGSISLPFAATAPSLPDVGQLDIDTAAVLSPFDRNGFTDLIDGTYGGQFAADPTRWGLSYEYTFKGSVVSASGLTDYTAGDISIYFENGTVPVKVLSLAVRGTSNQINNQTIFGVLDFSGMTPAELTYAQQFWKDASPNGINFYDKWLADPMAITWQLQNNVIPPTPDPAELFNGNATADGSTWIFRQAAMNGTMTFNVPEPGSVALIGLALAGLGLATRRRQQA